MNASLYHRRMAMIFNEWARRYAENPNQFEPILDANGNAVDDYGEEAATYFKQIADDLDKQGKLPTE